MRIKKIPFFLENKKNIVTFAFAKAIWAKPTLWHSQNRKVGRVIDRAGLEIRYTLLGIGGLNPSPSATWRGKCSQRCFP